MLTLTCSPPFSLIGWRQNRHMRKQAAIVRCCSNTVSLPWRNDQSHRFHYKTNKIIWHNLPYWQLIVTAALWSCGYHSDAMEHIRHQMSFIHLLLITCRQKLIWMAQRLNLHIRCIFSYELFMQKKWITIGHEFLNQVWIFWTAVWNGLIIIIFLIFLISRTTCCSVFSNEVTVPPSS